MIRSPRYPSSGDTIHADPLAIISPEGRTFSLFYTDDIEMHGLVSSIRNGLLFYDNDREVFLHRPVFPDLLSNNLTPLHIGVINEFQQIRTWAEFGKFLLKIDKILILDQFRQYNTPETQDTFLIRARDFCNRENIHLTDEDFRAPDAMRRLAIAIGALETMKSSFFVSSVPDILLPHPDSMLCEEQTRRRASRWLKVAAQEGQMDTGLKEKLDMLDRQTAIRQIVAKYMNDVEKWEGSPLAKSQDGSPLSRADLEDFLTGCATVYCPSPLGWTPRLRFAFYCPPEFRQEPVDVKIEFIAELEKRLGELCGFEVKLLYIPESNCLVLESLGESGGGEELPCTFENGQRAEIEIMNLGNSQLTGLSHVVQSARHMMGPEMVEAQIANARRTVQELTMNEVPNDGENLEFWENMGQQAAASESESMGYRP